MGGPAWSPDGTHIAFNCDRTNMWVVGADGSELTQMPDGRNHYWSPDGSRIAFELPHSAQQGKLAIANADGTHIQVIGYPAHAGPWNPLSLSESGDREPTATAGSGATPLVYVIVLLGVVGVVVFVRKARSRTASLGGDRGNSRPRCAD